MGSHVCSDMLQHLRRQKKKTKSVNPATVLQSNKTAVVTIMGISFHSPTTFRFTKGGAESITQTPSYSIQSCRFFAHK